MRPAPDVLGGWDETDAMLVDNFMALPAVFTRGEPTKGMDREP